MTPFGDDALRFAAPPEIQLRRALLDRLRAVPGVRDVVLAETVGLVVLRADAERALVADALAVDALAGSDEGSVAEHHVRVVYDGEDLAAFPPDVVALHTGAVYTVAMLGFLPGFAYLRGLPDALALPRRAPRPRVPARSVAVGAEYTGIYPVASAGGWHLLGRALELPRWALGDRVRFEAVAGGGGGEAGEAAAPGAAAFAPAPPRGRRAVVTRAAGLALFVDGGRAGQMHEGMPPGGPLVRGLFERANAAVGNPPDACAIELTGQLEIELDGVRVAVASGPSRVAYLAVEGGFDAPVMAGSRCALLAAGMGRPLRRGDAIGVGGARLASSGPTPPDGEVVLRPGPDATPGMLERIASAEYVVSPTSDRAGTRLVGPTPPLDGGTRPSTPMTLGAIERTPSGLVVLGPDHPTTGGYPVVAVVARASLDAFFGRPLGGRVRFRV